MSHPRSSRQRYRGFVEDYRHRRLDAATDARRDVAAPGSAPLRPRRQYLREYLRWLAPHRYRIAALLALALLTAGLQMIEPLFLRFIIDRVLLNTGLASATRLVRLNLAGAVFVGVIVLSIQPGGRAP